MVSAAAGTMASASSRTPQARTLMVPHLPVMNLRWKADAIKMRVFVRDPPAGSGDPGGSGTLPGSPAEQHGEPDQHHQDRKKDLQVPPRTGVGKPHADPGGR